VHHTNYRESSYLRELGELHLQIREYLQDFVFMKRTRRLVVVYPNRLQ
jgi:hypothetical protein